MMNPHACIKLQSRRTARSTTLARARLARALVFIGFVLAIFFYIILTLRAFSHLKSYPAESGISLSLKPPARSTSTNALIQLKEAAEDNDLTHSSSATTAAAAARNEYDCAIYWLRMPKTASTTIARTFMFPFLKNPQLFTKSENGPNTCFTGVGGCSEYWKGWKPESMNETQHANQTVDNTTLIPAPLFGNGGDEIKKQRCFPVGGEGRKPPLKCHEYDARTRTLNFGPDRHVSHVKEGKEETIEGTQIQFEYFSFGPELKTHVGLDPSLFGWLMPKKPMVFSTFRDPVERLLSSFHYGIQFGGGRPGEVKKCQIPRAPSLNNEHQYDWQSHIVDARQSATVKNNSTEYQQLLREYLTDCHNAADNAYVQFLDPDTKDTQVALANLERYVIVGLQSDLDRTLQRWKNIVLQSCGDHPKNEELRERLNGTTADEHYRKSVSQVNPQSNDKEEEESGNNEESSIAVDNAIELMSPQVDSFDPDLQEIVREFTKGDEVIYKRVVEMYDRFDELY